MSQPTTQSVFLDNFELWGTQKKQALLVAQTSIDFDEGPLTQGVVFFSDFKRHLHELSSHSKYEIADLTQSIATLALGPFALFVDVYRLATKSINTATFFKNSYLIPKHMVLSIFKIAFLALRVINKTVNALSIEIGFLAWHGGEKLVSLIKGSTHTVLSNKKEIRDIVYNSIGVTLLAAATVFTPVAPIQMVALPIIIGSIYGTINNQFTVRACPEYYTMGHYYDGKELRGHAIKTNNTLIKPIVTGCYATTMVTKLAGVILAGAGTIPYTAAILPVPYVGAAIAGVTVIALCVAHIFSELKRKKLEKNLEECAKLADFEWTEELRNMKSKGFEEFVIQRVDQMKSKINLLNESDEKQELKKEFNKKINKLVSLLEEIQSSILDADLPIKYIAGWQANSTRNGIGYLFAGGGTLALTISTVFLRIFAM